jgi:predicted ester cyclase
MKKSIGLAVALSLVACKGKKPEENKEPVTAAPAVQAGSAGSAAAPAAEKPLVGPELAERYKKCVGLINDNKIDEFIGTCVAADYKGHEGDNVMSGADALKGTFTRLKTAFPDWKLSPQLILISGRNILGVQLSQGTNTGPMTMPGAPETPATNKKFGQLVFHKLAINDQNKATEEWAYGDMMTMMGQLGLLPPNAPPVRPVMEKGWDGAPIVAVSADNDSEKKNLEVVKKMLDAFNAHKAADMVALVSDDYVESDQGDPQDHTGKKAMDAGVKEFLTAFPDGKVTVDSTYAAGDYVVALGTFEGTNTGDLGKMIKKTGKKVTLHVAEISKLKDGKITNLWRFGNGMEMAMQLGLMKPPGAGAGSAAAGSATPKK